MDSARGSSTVPWAVRRVAAVRRDAAALNATLAAAQGGCGGGGEDRLGSSPYSARERNRNGLEGCVGVSLSYRVLSSPLLCVLALPGALLPRIPRRAFASLAFTRLALASYSPFRASRKNLSSRSNSQTAR